MEALSVGAGHAPRADAPQHILQLLEGSVGTAKKPLALGGEGDAAVATHQQPHAQLRLERRNLPADRRLGKAQVLRCLRDAHAAPYRDKATHHVERGQLNQREGKSHSHGACEEEKRSIEAQAAPAFNRGCYQP